MQESSHTAGAKVRGVTAYSEYPNAAGMEKAISDTGRTPADS